MTWRVGAVGLLVCVVGMGIGAAPPEAGAALRVVFVVSALGGSWIAWTLSTRDDLSLRRIVGLAIVLRVLMLPLLPSLSDDGYRYIWDGVLTVHGISPYADRPASPRFAEWHDEVVYQEMNSPEYFSVYPPVSQAIFAVGGLVYPLGWQASWYAIKLILVVLEGVGIACLARVVPRSGLALYALHPLPIIEIAGQAHTEGALVAALGGVLVALARHPKTAGVALALAGWTKLFPFGLVLALRSSWRGLAAFAIATAVGGLALLPSSGLEHVLESVRLYGGTLDFYAAPYLAIKAALYPVAGEGAGRLAATLLSLGWAVSLVVLARSMGEGVVASQRYVALGVVAYALASPMQHPWNWIAVLYVMPLLQDAKWIAWTASISLVTYLLYVGIEPAYGLAIAVGWGGGALLYLLSRRALAHRD